MSEEIALASADLETVRQLRAALDVAETEIKALRSLEQLDQALGAMSVAEIDSARARVDSALVPQLARMLGLCLIKDDGEVYNVVTWEIGSAEPLGTMELILQRTEGKTPTQLRVEADRENAELRGALAVAMAENEQRIGFERALLVQNDALRSALECLLASPTDAAQARARAALSSAPVWKERGHA